MNELHLTKKDFAIDWFSGTGKGGQHRNKHQNCCRITHVETGLRAQSTECRDRPGNQRAAFRRLVSMILAHYEEPEAERRMGGEVVRNYHAERNEVLDKASRLRLPYKHVVIDGILDEMIEARRKVMGTTSAL